jgi:hypothetical protein
VGAIAPKAIKSPKDVLLPVVDTGFSIDSLWAVAYDVKFDQSLSFSPGGSIGQPGSYPGEEHGSMCAYDASLIGTMRIPPIVISPSTPS